MMLRISRIMEMNQLAGCDEGITNPYQAVQAMPSLRLRRQKLTEAFRLWKHASDKVALANSLPKSFQIGRFGQGVLSDKQKLDIMHWCRVRETTNTTLTKGEVLTAMKKFALSNAGVAVTDTGHCLSL